MSDPAQNYDPRRFQTTVPYYTRYRLGYPDLLIQRVIAQVGLARGDAVMDLGCGPGLVAIPFARAGMAVMGVDPEPAMLEAAKAAAAEAGVALDLRQGSSFDLPRGIGPFKLVTMGRSFLWMDREATLKALDGLVTPDGAVYYELGVDNLAGIEDGLIVPASEIIHDRFNCLFHPLVGISPIFASGLAATQGLSMQNNSANLFANASNPGGLLVAPGKIEPSNAERLKKYWDDNFTGKNAGKIAVLGDGLEYKGLTINPVDAQLIEQLKWSSEVVASTFHVPLYKINVGQMPTYSNIQSLNIEYYSQCLQVLIEAIEVCMDEGLGTGATLGTEFDVENLLRMDSVTQMDMLDKGKNIFTPNEARAKLDKKPVTGGNDVYRQQQDYSLSALAKRDAQADPFGSNAPKQPSAADQAANDNAAQLQAAKAMLAITKGFA